MSAIQGMLEDLVSLRTFILTNNNRTDYNPSFSHEYFFKSRTKNVYHVFHSPRPSNPFMVKKSVSILFQEDLNSWTICLGKFPLPPRPLQCWKYQLNSTGTIDLRKGGIFSKVSILDFNFLWVGSHISPFSKKKKSHK